jgi:hypothetical protein
MPDYEQGFKDGVERAVQKVPRRQPLQLIAPWDRASGRHRGLTIAICEEMLAKFGAA